MDFVEVSGSVPFREWIGGLPQDAQAVIDARLLSMAGMVTWSEKWISKYKGVDNLLELRITYNKVQYRPLCCYGPKRKQITLLGGAIEKDWKLPKGILESAERRIKELKEDESRARRHQFD